MPARRQSNKVVKHLTSPSSRHGRARYGRAGLGWAGRGVAWHGQLVAVHSPFWQQMTGRPVMITMQQYKLIAKVLPGWKGNQRALAASLGYSVSGLNESVTTLAKLGVLARLSRRGRLGWTRLILVKGVHVTSALENVRERISTVLRTPKKTTTTYRTFSASSPPRGSGAVKRRPLVASGALS